MNLAPWSQGWFVGRKKNNMQVNWTLDMNDEVGMCNNKTFQSLVCDVGGFENLPFVMCDVRNFIGRQRMALGKDGDGQTLMTYFSHMRQLNNDFSLKLTLILTTK